MKGDAMSDGTSDGTSDDARLYAPSTGRNRNPILGALQLYLPERGLVLEIASGTGEHVSYFASQSPADLVFQPSDVEAEHRASIDAWVRGLELVNVRPAIALDAVSDAWPVAQADAVLCINMSHISPWAATEGLIRGAARTLAPGGFLYLYGPYRRDGRHTAASNEGFEQWLKSQSPEYGVRDLEAVAALAAAHGFSPPDVIDMPANNFSVVFRR